MILYPITKEDYIKEYGISIDIFGCIDRIGYF